MTQYFKQHLSADRFIFFSFYGDGQPSITNKTVYPVRESVFYHKNFPNISRYSVETNWVAEADLIPCSKEEFEAAKTAALTAIASLMTEPQLQAA